MITEILAWITAQNYWAEPILNVVIAIACIKYILFTYVNILKSGQFDLRFYFFVFLLYIKVIYIN